FQTIFLPVLFGGVLFYITVPLKELLMRRLKFYKWASMLTIVVLLIGLFALAIMVVGPPIGQQVANLVDNAPEIVRATNDFILDTIEIVGDPADLPDWVQDAIASATEFAKNLSLSLGNWIVQIFQSVVQGTLILVLTPFFFIFMLKDHDKLVPFITQFFTGERKEWVKKTIKDIDSVLNLHIRGQLLISAILATMLFIGYTAIALEFALLLSVFALFMNVIPSFGSWIAFVPALLISAFQAPILIIWVSAITLAAQQIDANLITPNIMGKTLNVHPLTIITILLAAGKIAGFIGILLAVPAYAVGK